MQYSFYPVKLIFVLPVYEDSVIIEVLPVVNGITNAAAAPLKS